MHSYDKANHTEFIGRLLNGYDWERLLAEYAALARDIELSTGCTALRGSQKYPTILDYLRDAVGLMTFFLDNGASAIYDPQ